MHKGFSSLLACFLLFMSIIPSFAVNPDEVLSDPALEARARSLSAEIRCLVCQNQSIDDSDAQLARDLRLLVREQLVEGASDEEILDFLVARYGEFVLLKPPVNLRTYFLWGIPFLLVGLGMIAIWRFSNARKVETGSVSKLSEEEKQRLSKLLDE
ncbi:MAG: cytochrome c-type biogenesis protein [Pseudomonadota bacterium]